MNALALHLDEAPFKKSCVHGAIVSTQRINLGSRLSLLALAWPLVFALNGCRTLPTTNRPAALPSTDAERLDTRVVIDRLNPQNNVGGADLSALNAVGVIAPVDYQSRHVYAYGTGFLIDACHVLTAAHVMYGWRGDYATAPPLGQPAQFALGQTSPEDHNETEGLKFFYQGAVTAHGNSGRHGGRTDHSDIDWAIVTLSTTVSAIAPIPLHALDPRKDGQNWISNAHETVGAAGFPGDRMDLDLTQAHRRLWGSYGQVLRVSYDTSSGYASMTSTNPATAGTSGGAMFAVVAKHIVAVGIVQSVFGDGIHHKNVEPTVSVLITPTLLNEIESALHSNPCAP